MSGGIDGNFAQTCKLLFGAEYGPLEKYGEWLSRRLPKHNSVASAIGKGNVILPEYSFFGFVPKSRAVAFGELENAAKKTAAGIAGNESMADIMPKIRPVAYFVTNFAEGRNLNVENTVAHIDCINVHNSFDPFESKNSAYVAQTLRVENIFGTYYALDCAFCIHCYTALNLKRCFEMDGAKNCSDCMFCHNVENLESCMFCFNTKAKKYAICNVEVGKEAYQAVANVMKGWIAKSLAEKAWFEMDIFNVLSMAQFFVRKKEASGGKP